MVHALEAIINLLPIGFCAFLGASKMLKLFVICWKFDIMFRSKTLRVWLLDVSRDYY